MSKGGNSGTQQSEVKQTTTNLPAYAEPYYTQLLERGMYESARPYEAYPAQRIAQFSPMQGQAMQGIGGLQQPGQTGLATELATTVGLQPTNRGSNIASGFNPNAVQTNYQAGQFSPGYTAGGIGADFQAGTMTDPNVIAQYMNPYQQLATDVEKREATRVAAQQTPQIQAQATLSGGGGGTRESLLMAENERNLMQQLGDIQSRGNQAGYGQALQAFEQDRGARLNQANFGLEKYNAGEQARQRAAQMGMDAQGQEDAARQAMEKFSLDTQQFNTETQRQRTMLGLAGLESDQASMAQRLGSAELLGNLGQNQQEMELQRLQAQMQAGNQQQALGQQSLNMGYEDFLRQQAFGKEQLAYLSALLQGTPIQPGSTTTAYGKTPSTEQQLLGSGISALGLYNSLGKTGP
tara:strand:+ start:760 stop:1983 length:1224 start_codon:yes stop_codon:yes gene_type:complete